ncbi:hypothetical protein [Mycobacterium sp. TY813]|uniref:hypothetical protein n=1 Tax=Mycobacterium TaxID=1763 RepID=UPI002740FECD|nr:hypothetical protein [Mycobacterium sp. TY813]MDP7727619.1 hypothetical protein [Mycobacterium sp. TY813]
MVLADDDPRHGTTNGYGNLGCRCDLCRAANTRNRRAYLARVRAEGRILGEHGSEVAYDSGCRCTECRERHNERWRTRERARRAAQSDG